MANESQPKPAQDPQTGPVGIGPYEVLSGDCIDSIATVHGFFWWTIWNDPANRELRTIRKDPNVLLPGDRVTIPPLRTKTVACSTGKRHQFKRMGVPARLRFRLSTADGRPRIGLEYTIAIDGRVRTGMTDNEGAVTIDIAPTAKTGRLTILGGHRPEEYVIKLGALDPITEISGIRGRLRNLGYECGEDEAQTRNAISCFQQANGLEATGTWDQETQQKLQELHGC
jgi:hypothetical protein